jgi:1-acyl-sn-glycerol-3-phosphate acyltransferase
MVTVLASEVHPAPASASTDRDVATIRQWSRVLDRWSMLFSPEVAGVDNVPVDGPALLVGNHSLYWMAEGWVAARAVFERRGIDAPLCGLAYDLLFAVPWLGNQLRRTGVIPAAPGEAEAALGRGECVMVYPGGDLDACRTWSQRDRVELGGRKGFVRLALRTGVPVVPVVAHGGTHSVVVLARGDRLARAMRLHKLRINVFPILAGLPFGVVSILTPPPPMPAAITIQFLPALDWSGYGPQAAEDPAVVDACYAEITSVMQAAMDQLSADRPHPATTGIARLLTGPLRVVGAGGRRLQG